MRFMETFSAFAFLEIVIILLVALIIGLLILIIGLLLLIIGLLPPPVVHTKAFHRSSNTPLVVVEVDDGVDTAWAGKESIR